MHPSLELLWPRCHQDCITWSLHSSTRWTARLLLPRLISKVLVVEVLVVQGVCLNRCTSYRAISVEVLTPASARHLPLPSWPRLPLLAGYPGRKKRPFKAGLQVLLSFGALRYFCLSKESFHPLRAVVGLLRWCCCCVVEVRAFFLVSVGCQCLLLVVVVFAS